MSRSEKFSYETSGNKQPVRADIVLDATELLATPEEPAERETPRKTVKKAEKKAAGPAEKKTEKKVEDMKKKSGKKKRRLCVLPVIAAALALVLLVGALAVFGVVPLPGGAEGDNSYTVSDAETLARYLRHPLLKAGDTIVVEGNLDVDINTLFDGFAEVPLVNYDCAGGDVTFTGGTALLTGGNSKATMNGVKFADCDVYIEAPACALTWVDCADDTNINARSLNGQAHKRELPVKLVGARFAVPVTFTNESASALSNVTVKLASANFIFPDGESYTVKSLGAGESVTEDVEVVAVVGGRGRVVAYAADSAGSLAVTGGSDYVSIMGGGWYAGDVHTHTEASGRAATAEDNVRYGYGNGMSFIISAERNAAAPTLGQSAVDSLVGESNAFLQIAGYELCEDSSVFASLPSFEGYVPSMDFLVLGADVIPNNHYIVPDTNDLARDSSLTPWLLQDAIYEVEEAGGLSVLTHFFDNDIEKKISVSKSLSDLDGIEVLTKHHGLNDMETAVALNIWKLYSTFGAQKVFALAASNNETSEEVGAYFIKGEMSGLSEDAAFGMIESGRYFFSSGPELYFALGGAGMGGDFTTSAGAVTKATLFASDDVPLTKVVLTKYTVTHSKNDIVSEVVFEYDLTGKGVCAYSDFLDVTVSPDEYYIFEAYSEENNLGTEQGYASSNPIYAVSGSDPETALSGKAVDDMSYLLGGTAQRAGNGRWYLTAKSFVPFLFRASSAGNRVSVVYHKLNSDATCDYLTVLVTAADGTQSSEKVYLINS